MQNLNPSEPPRIHTRCEHLFIKHISQSAPLLLKIKSVCRKTLDFAPTQNMHFSDLTLEPEVIAMADLAHSDHGQNGSFSEILMSGPDTGFDPRERKTILALAAKLLRWNSICPDISGPLMERESYKIRTFPLWSSNRTYGLSWILMEFVIIRAPCDVTVVFVCVRQLIKVSRQPETGRLGKNTASWCIPLSPPNVPPSALFAAARDGTTRGKTNTVALQTFLVSRDSQSSVRYVSPSPTMSGRSLLRDVLRAAALGRIMFLSVNVWLSRCTIFNSFSAYSNRIKYYLIELTSSHQTVIVQMDSERSFRAAWF